jgi:hypothetical protein
MQDPMTRFITHSASTLTVAIVIYDWRPVIFVRFETIVFTGLLFFASAQLMHALPWKGVA